MTITIRGTLVAAAAMAAALPVAPARAQTAYDVNRLNQAVQICNSPMGAGMAECAKLRGQLGGAPALGGLGGGGAAAGVASMLGAALAGARSQQTVAPPAAASPGALQQAVATCVQNAKGDNAAIQTCLQIAGAGHGPAAVVGGPSSQAMPPGYTLQPAPNPFGALLPKR